MLSPLTAREIPFLLRNPKLQCRDRKSSRLKRMNPVHTLLFCFLEVHFNIILPHTPKSFKKSILFSFQTKIVCSFLNSPLLVTSPSHRNLHQVSFPIIFDGSLTLEMSSDSCYIPPLGSPAQCSPKTFEHPRPLRIVGDPDSYPHRATARTGE
jgi:hypothetical protein